MVLAPQVEIPRFLYNAGTSKMLLLLGLLACATPQKLQIIESIPSEIEVNDPQIEDAAPTWVAMFDSAQTSIDIASFYISPSDKQDALDPVWASLRKAVDRGVHLRVLVDLSFLTNTPNLSKSSKLGPTPS